MPKEIRTATMKGAKKKKRVRARKRWSYEVQECLNIRGINKRQTICIGSYCSQRAATLEKTNRRTGGGAGARRR